jgi:transcriptional regulator with XRE-family HTH domain
MPDNHNADMNETMGSYIRGRRLAMGMTQEELADAAGVTQASISDLERGRTARSDAGIRRRLAATLGVTHLDLLVAAGELTAEEAGMRPEPATTDPPAVVLICEKARRIAWTRGRLGVITWALDNMMRETEVERQAAGNPSQGDNSASDEAALSDNPASTRAVRKNAGGSVAPSAAASDSSW